MRSREKFIKFRVIKREHVALVYDKANKETTELVIEIVIPGTVTPPDSVWSRYVKEWCDERNFVPVNVTVQKETVEQVVANKIDIYYNCPRNDVYELGKNE